MHAPGDGWSAATPDREVHPDLPRPTFGGLPRDQKCELATLAAAAVMTTTLLVMPLMPTSRLESVPVTIQLPPVLFTPTVQSPLPGSFVHLSTSRIAGPSSRRPAPPRPARSPRAAAAEGDHGRLARFLLGDGRYRIQPFPSPDASR